MKFRQIEPPSWYWLKIQNEYDGLYQACINGDKKRFDEIEKEITAAYDAANGRKK